MKIIFLDIDGVLTSSRCHLAFGKRGDVWDDFDPVAVKLIERLCIHTNSKIVISSTWRYGNTEALVRKLKETNLHKLVHKDWKTPVQFPADKGKEIMQWLNKHPEISTYVIFDDESISDNDLTNNFVQTDTKNGLLFEHFKTALSLLKNKPTIH